MNALPVCLVMLLTTLLVGIAHAAPGDFIRSWGSFGSGDGQFNCTMGVAIDSNGNVYVADYYNNRVEVFDQTGKFLRKWGSFGSGDGQFQYPHAIAIDSQNQVYVADGWGHRVEVFDQTGRFLGKWGSFGSGDGQFNYPAGIAIDNSRGLIYIADLHNNRIEVFDQINQIGSLLKVWGNSGSEDGQFNGPHAIALDSQGQIYIADVGNYRIQVFNQAGAFQRQWGSKGIGEGQFMEENAIAVDAQGQVYVTDAASNRVQVFNQAGAFLRQWGSTGTENGKFQYLHGITLDSQGNIYVADMNNHRIQVFEGGSFANPDHTPPGINITAPVDQKSYVLNSSELANYTCIDAGSGMATCEGPVANSSPFDTATGGWKNFIVTATDKAGNRASLTHAYQVIYSFTGFFAPVDNSPTFNVAKAGSAIPIKFSLGGNQGLEIFGFMPASQTIACDSTFPLDVIEEIVIADGSSLNYDPVSNQYIYVWKTDKSWATTCRQWTMRLKDGTEQRANFEFKK